MSLDDLDILIDAGDKSHGDEVVSYLRKAGVDDLELVIGTHSHADHIGGLPEVFEAFRIDRYIDSGTATDTVIYKTVTGAVAKEGCQYSADDSELIKYGNLVIQIIETGDNNDDLNDDSVVVLASYGSTKMLFAGDASSAVDKQLISVGHVDLYKAEHHGSHTGNSATLLSVLSPDISVISYGIGNSYGHPHQEAMANMQRYSGQVLWTAGKSIILTSDGHNLKLQ